MNKLDSIPRGERTHSGLLGEGEKTEDAHIQEGSTGERAESLPLSAGDSPRRLGDLGSVSHSSHSQGLDVQDQVLPGLAPGEGALLGLQTATF